MIKDSNKIAIAYTVAGIVWILWSDYFFFNINSHFFQSSKGILYVIVTGLLLWLLIRNMERKNRQIRQNLEQEVLLTESAERRTLEERNLLRTLIDNLPDYVYIKDSEGNFIVLNQTLMKLMRIDSEAEAVKIKRSTFMPGESDRDKFSSDEKIVLKTKKPILNLEQRYQDHDGRAVHVLAAKVPLLDDAGNITAIIGINRDITAIHNARQSEDLVLKIIEALGNHEQLKDGLANTLQIIGEHFHFELAEAWLAGADKNEITMASSWAKDPSIHFHDNHKQMFTPGEGLPGKTYSSKKVQIWNDVMDNPNFTRSKNLGDTVVSTGIGIPLILHKNVIAVFTFLAKEKFTNHEELKLVLTQISSQIVMHIERKRHERKVEETNERITNLLESISDGFFAVDSDWTVSYWNTEAEKILQTRREDMIGRKLTDLYPEDTEDHQSSYSQYKKVMSEKTPVVFEEFYEPFQIWLELSVYPSRDGISVFMRDITENRRLKQEVERRIEELAISNAELEQFAYIASHDMQEPLRMVTGFLSQLEKKYSEALDDKGRQYIHFAVDGAVRMRKLILDLLEYSKVGKADYHVETFSVSTLIADILQMNQTLIEELGATITVAEMPQITGGKTLIQQLFHNLIMNALKYSKPDVPPQIQIGSVSEDNHWKFWVSDNGIGVDADYFDKIFVIFQRLHNKEEYSGTGIGLSICKRIVENHGGRIWLESEEGKGSVFYFTIKK